MVYYAVCDRFDSEGKKLIKKEKCLFLMENG